MSNKLGYRFGEISTPTLLTIVDLRMRVAEITWQASRQLNH